jgi:hypothetical protein
MANALSKLLNTTGPERTAWLERQLEPVKNALASAAYYVPPELRQTGGQVANALAMFSPGADVMDAAQSSGDMMDAARRGDLMGMAGAGAGIAAAGLGMFVPGTAKGYGSAAEEVAGLLRDGRGADITDEMIAKADPAELFDLYGAGKTGMDMPMDEASRMARAQGMGFDTARPIYHGTPQNLDAFDPDESNWGYPASWFSENRFAADEFAKDRTDPRAGRAYRVDAFTRADLKAIDPMGDAARLADEIGAGPINSWDDAAGVLDWATYQTDMLETAAREGFGGARFTNVGDVPSGAISTHLAIADPASIRRTTARFDPRLKHLANLSAAGAGVIGYNALRDERNRNEQGGM